MEPAYLSEELDLTDAERIGAAHTAQLTGIPTKQELLDTIERHGQVDGIVESALLLPLADYYEVFETWTAAPKPALPKTRKRR